MSNPPVHEAALDSAVQSLRARLQACEERLAAAGSAQRTEASRAGHNRMLMRDLEGSVCRRIAVLEAVWLQLKRTQAAAGASE